MCGRYTLTTSVAELGERFLATPASLTAPDLRRYNIAPTQLVLVVSASGQRQIQPMRWGLIPAWARDPAIGAQCINARAETVADKPAFRSALRQRRCLVLADGFYEWRKDGRRKQPLCIVLKPRQPFAFAGLWERWRSPADEDILSCTVITTAANELLAPIHDRMPVILPRAAEAVWLDPRIQEPEQLLPLLQPYPAAQMDCFEVATTVNSVQNESPDCLVPLPKPLL